MWDQAALILSLINFMFLLWTIRFWIRNRHLIRMAKGFATMVSAKGVQSRRTIASSKRRAELDEKLNRNLVANIPFADQIKKYSGFSDQELVEYATDPVLREKVVGLIQIGMTLSKGLGEKIDQFAENLPGLGKKAEKRLPP